MSVGILRSVDGDEGDAVERHLLARQTMPEELAGVTHALAEKGRVGIEVRGSLPSRSLSMHRD
jgi:hypothetical protein